MIFELLAVVFAGFAGGGMGALARRLVRATPRWIVPIAAGGTMLTAAVSLEYAWFGRTTAALPETIAVAATDEVRAPWQPWTYVVPYVDRFVAVDRGSVLTNPEAPGTRIADVLIFGRWTPPRRVRSAFDCEGGRRADLLDGVTLGEGGAIEGATWLETGREDPVTRLACAA